jgi:hypothetical protein
MQWSVVVFVTDIVFVSYETGIAFYQQLESIEAGRSIRHVIQIK